MSDDRFDTIADMMRRLGRDSVAARCGVGDSATRRWEARGIPVRHYAPILALAAERGVGLNLDDLDLLTGRASGLCVVCNRALVGRARRTCSTACSREAQAGRTQLNVTPPRTAPSVDSPLRRMIREVVREELAQGK